MYEKAKYLHEDDVEYFLSLIPIAMQAAKENGLELLEMEPKKRPQTGYGLCYAEQKLISVAVRDKATQAFGGQWAKGRYRHEFVLETIAHEIAHLQHQNHSKEFKLLESQVLETVKRLA